MAHARANPITTQDAFELAPLQRSHEANQLEAELKGLFALLYDQFIRPGEAATRTMGMPQLGDSDQLERAVKSEGLALLRRADEETMRYVFRAWRAHNPRRGLGMLKAYLQLFWPNAFEVYQLWHPITGGTYPEDAVEAEAPGHFLTSRVRVYISAEDAEITDVLTASASLRSVVPARTVLEVQILSRSEIGGSLAMGLSGAVIQTFNGTFS